MVCGYSFLSVLVVAPFFGDFIHDVFIPLVFFFLERKSVPMRLPFDTRMDLEERSRDILYPRPRFVDGVSFSHHGLP